MKVHISDCVTLGTNSVVTDYLEEDQNVVRRISYPGGGFIVVRDKQNDP